MMNVVEIVFSPTGGTEKVVHTISGCWSKYPITIDLSNPQTDFTQYEIRKEDMVLIGMPSFGGRAPAVAIERLKQLKGNSARCTLVCVYGNRAYEDTLAEMEDAAKACGFKIIAAIAAVAEHSIITKYAANRPDASDEKQLKNFADRIAGIEEDGASVPGNRPYKKSGGASLVPKATRECVKCGLCAAKCPVQAISKESFATDAKVCISCMRCVKQCPHDARKVNSAMVSVAALAIKKACKPYTVKGKPYFDGALSDPVPIEKAFEFGCDRVVVTLTKPESEIRNSKKDEKLAACIRKKYPAAAEQLRRRAQKYNDSVALAQKYAKQGKALIVAPDDTCGVDTLKRDKVSLQRLYEKGYKEGQRITNYLFRDREDDI